MSMASAAQAVLSILLVPCHRTTNQEAYTLEFNGSLGRHIMDFATALGSQQHGPAQVVLAVPLCCLIEDQPARLMLDSML